MTQSTATFLTQDAYDRLKDELTISPETGVPILPARSRLRVSRGT